MTPKNWLHEKEIILSNGHKALWSYDTETDFLEIFFEQKKATATIELDDGIYLRINRQQEELLSIGFLGVTYLTQPREYGLPLLTLEGLHQLPSQEAEMLLNMLQKTPLNTILTLHSFESSSHTRKIPVLTLTPSMLSTLA